MKKLAVVINLFLSVVFCGLLCACGGDPQQPDAKAYSITVQSSDCGRISCPTQSAQAGETVQITASPEEGYELGTLYVNGESVNGTSFTMPDGDVTVVAEFTKKKYTIQTVAIGGGSVSTATDAVYGEKITVDVVPDEGSSFEKLLVNGVEVYAETFLMPKRDVTVTAVFTEMEKYAESELILSCATCNTYSVVGQSPRAYEVAQSRWFASYGENGITLKAQVTDENLYTNHSYATLEKNDSVAFYLKGEQSQPVYVLINSNGEYKISGAAGSVEYGTDLYTRAYLTTEEINGFGGYCVEVYLSYGLFGLDGSSVGNLYLLPELVNAGVQNGGGAAIDTASYGDRQDLSDYALINADGTFVLPERGETYTFIGDSYFDVAFWYSFHEEFKDYDAFNIAIGGTTSIQWQNSLKSVSLCAPDKLVINVGVNDLNRALIASRDTASDLEADGVIINNLKKLFTQLHEVLPECEIYFVSICKMPARSDNYSNVVYINEAISEYAGGVPYLTFIDALSYVTDGSGTPYTSLYATDRMHLDRPGYAIYSREIKKALGIGLPEGETFGSVGNYASTYGFDFSQDSGDTPTLRQTGGNSQFACFRSVNKNTFYAEVKITVKEILNGDRYPKFGFFVCSGSYMLSFYIDCKTDLTATGVGAVGKVGYKDYSWTNTTNANVSGMKFSNGNYVTLGLSRQGASFIFYVNGSEALSLTDSTMGTSNGIVGLFSFNTAFEATDYSIA